MDSSNPEPAKHAAVDAATDTVMVDGDTVVARTRTPRTRSRRPPPTDPVASEPVDEGLEGAEKPQTAKPARRKRTSAPVEPVPTVRKSSRPKPARDRALEATAFEEAAPKEASRSAETQPIEAMRSEARGVSGEASDRALHPRPTIHRRAIPSDHLDEDALKVLRRLHRNGYKAYLVGGGVRDLLLGRKPKDFDVATSARPHQVKTLFRNCRIIGRRFRLAHILFGAGKVIETATFRRDPSAPTDEETFMRETLDAREAIDSGEMDAFGEGALRPLQKARDDDADLLIRTDNVFGEPHEDALRRDFTINGLFYDIERGEVIDYVGGLRDLERRAITTIGMPDVRFREDPVRILRAIKFSARLDLGIDPECYDAMVAQREELRKAAPPRLLEEILRLLRGGAAHRSMWLAWETGVLSVVLPELAVFLDDDAPSSRLLWGRLDAIDASIRKGYVPTDSVLLAAVLLGPAEEAIDGSQDLAAAYDEFMHEVTESLAVPRRMQERMRAIVTSQRRLARGQVGTLARRDFFAEAAHLFEIECAARGVRSPDLRVSADVEQGEGFARRRRRRRPRR